jgi:CheY-like chemotaxis protein
MCQKKIKMNFEFDEAIPTTVLGDPGKIKQILNNLISNAIKFTHSGGEISIIAKLLVLHKDDLTLQISVKDTGIGIPPAAQSKIFDMFSQADESTTRKFGGTGLGLTITKQLIELMGGKIELYSDGVSGSIFVLYLTLGIQNAPQVTSASSTTATSTVNADKASSFNAHVLIVEDNELNQEVAQDLLQLLGCHTDLVVSGEGALEAIKKKQYDFILMDCQMPGMDGFVTTQRIRELESNENQDDSKKNIIIALTANALKGTRERCLEAGMNDYLTKPINLDQLKDTIQRNLSSDTLDR